MADDGGASYDAWIEALCADGGPIPRYLTLEAAEKLWRSVCADGRVDAAMLAVVNDKVATDVHRATALQALTRARADRRATPAQTKAENVLAPFNPTPAEAVQAAVDMLGVHSADVVFDLGCGDGSFIVAAARRGATCIGVELEARFAEKASDAVAAAGLSACATIVCGDAMEADVSSATKIFVYLVPAGLAKMAPKLDAALERGASIVAYTFTLPGWTAAEKKCVGNAQPLYLYKRSGQNSSRRLAAEDAS
ncbi:S-adenosyl-L-methionine-dependent methyltransferase [Pelagophyceae sp. CCMP2097]|nr:S-adenosyl-L-methionine-dependent methyltransferase [Pelagophyceae sp. CCMP2097]